MDVEALTCSHSPSRSFSSCSTQSATRTQMEEGQKCNTNSTLQTYTLYKFYSTASQSCHDYRQGSRESEKVYDNRERERRETEPLDQTTHLLLGDFAPSSLQLEITKQDIVTSTTVLALFPGHWPAFRCL